MPINKDERSLILGKFTDSLQGLDPTELPPLANQLFALTTTVPLVMMTLFSLQKYFHTFYYKKLFMDMEIDSMTDSDSIGNAKWEAYNEHHFQIKKFILQTRARIRKRKCVKPKKPFCIT